MYCVCYRLHDIAPFLQHLQFPTSSWRFQGDHLPHLLRFLRKTTSSLKSVEIELEEPPVQILQRCLEALSTQLTTIRIDGKNDEEIGVLNSFLDLPVLREVSLVELKAYTMEDLEAVAEGKEMLAKLNGRSVRVLTKQPRLGSTEQ
ncbi:hypothetical protein MNV49_003246 [Pseudohyphozyma bogoriensis]|nr:hypothetical protein MNV49_003246 [Pseudohyphozyma bogoriensis]